MIKVEIQLLNLDHFKRLNYLLNLSREALENIRRKENIEERLSNAILV